MTEEERKSYEILYEKIIFVDKYRMLKSHWIKFHNYIEKLQKEIEEKTTIIMAGAEKVKQLEKDLKKQEEEIEKYKETEQKIKDKINDYKTRTKYIADVYNSIYLEIAKDFEELLEED